MFWSWLNSACTAFSLSHSAPQQTGWDIQEAGRGHSQDSWPQLPKGISHTIEHHAQQFNSSTGRRRGGVCFPGYLLLRDCLGIGLLLGGKQLLWHHSFLILFPLLIELSLHQPINCLAFFLPILSSALLGGVSWCLHGSLAAGWGQPTTLNQKKIFNLKFKSIKLAG